MERLRVAAAQMESANGRVAENLERATGLAERAAAEGAQIVLFPEFMPTGYVFTEEIWDGAEPGDGPTSRWLSGTSRKLGVWLGTSFLEAEGSDFYNTFVLSRPDGKVAGRVRKQSPAAVEANFFKGQGGSHVVETGLGKVGVGICYENQLARQFRLMCEQPVDLVLMPHSAPLLTPGLLIPRRLVETYAGMLRRLPEWYASQLGVPVIFTNKVGPFSSPVPGIPFMKLDSRFPGESAIVDSDGTVLSRMGDEEGVAVAEVALDPARRKSPGPIRRGLWATDDVPWESIAFPIVEGVGILRYRLSRERARLAREITAR